jgi:hypothetical protein
MTTIGHVRGCNPQSMISFAAELSAQNDTFSTETERANRDVDTAMNHWHGDAATAASARALSHDLAANHLGCRGQPGHRPERLGHRRWPEHERA